MKHRAQQNGRLGSSKLLFDHRKKHKKNNLKKGCLNQLRWSSGKLLKVYSRQGNTQSKQNKTKSHLQMVDTFHGILLVLFHPITAAALVLVLTGGPPHFFLSNQRGNRAHCFAYYCLRLF